jgi:DNA-binding response OmpR family regulator
VVKALDMHTALDRLDGNNGKVDLVLTDVMMPNGTGWDLARRIERLQPGLRVLFMSGHTGDAIVRRGIGAAKNHFIGKPFSPNELATKVRQVLDYRG